MFNNLQIILVETRFPENIGAVARASANFGNAPIHLVQPERWDYEKALPMATKQGEKLLKSIKIHENLASSLVGCSLCLGTTARTGGIRREIFSPREIATHIIKKLKNNEKVALIFGPEDRGLENQQLEYCQQLVNIPTSTNSSSLNLAQAAMILLYECFLLKPKEKITKKTKQIFSRQIYNEERELLFSKLKECLVKLNVIQKDNPDYFFLQMARFLDRAKIRRHEMDMLLGICRQIDNLPKFKNKDE